MVNKIDEKSSGRILSSLGRWFSALVLLISLASCGSQRALMVHNLKDYGSPFLLNQLDSNELKYESLSFKFSAKYKNSKSKNDFGGQVRIQKDSLIWVSFSAALLEVGRLKVTRDSVFFISRFDKEYFKGDFELLSRLLKTRVDFDILQALITGNDFISFEKGDFLSDIESGTYSLTNSHRRKIRKHLRESDQDMAIYHKILLNPTNFKIAEVFLKEMGQDKRKLDVQYDDFISHAIGNSNKSQLFPSRIAFNISAEDRVSLKLKVSRVDINDKERFPFKIPRKYTPMLLPQR